MSLDRPRGGGLLVPPTDALGRAQRWRVRLSDAVEAFVRTLRSPATAAAYRSDLRLFQQWLAGQYGAGADSVTRFTRDNVLGYLAYLRGLGRHESTQHRKLATFRRFARWAVRERLLAADPVAAVESIPRRRRLPRPFTREETERLMALPLDATQNALRALLFYSGLRATPVARLQVKQVHPDRITYRGKGGRERSVPLHPALRSILWDYIASHTDLEGEAFLFRTRRGRPYTRRILERLTRAWGQAAGVAQCTPHRFRHTFATALLRVSRDLRKVQEALGHADVSSTVIYTEVAAEELAREVAKLRFGPSDGLPERLEPGSPSAQ